MHSEHLLKKLETSISSQEVSKSLVLMKFVDEIKSLMKTQGEPIEEKDLDYFLQLLVGDDVNKELKPVISADEFAENILGFEEVEELDEENEIIDGEDQSQIDPARTMGGVTDVIPEENEYA